MLTNGMTEGCHSDSVTATVQSQDSQKDVPGHQAQQQGGGDSADSPMQVDADDTEPNDRCMSPQRVDHVMSPLLSAALGLLYPTHAHPSPFLPCALL